MLLVSEPTNRRSFVIEPFSRVMNISKTKINVLCPCARNLPCRFASSLLFAAFFFCFCAAQAQPSRAAKPLRVLLLTGGCCHDYAKQKDLLKKGLEERANVVIDQIHTDDKSTKPPLAILGHADYAQGYDLVIHDECGADISDSQLVEG